MNSLSIVFPMYNERENISIAVSEALRVGYTITTELEIVIVDDASTDGSGVIADEIALLHPEVKVRHHAVNRKLGGALRTGFAAASKEWVLYMDSDLPIKMDDIRNAIPLTGEADVVIGWRKRRGESWKRNVMSGVYNWIIRRLFRLHVRDVNFSFKLLRRELLDQIRLRSEGSFIDAELLMEIKRVGARIAEIGFDYYPRVAGVSTLASNQVVLVMVGEMLRYRMKALDLEDSNLRGQLRRRVRSGSAVTPPGERMAPLRPSLPCGWSDHRK